MQPSLLDMKSQLSPFEFANFLKSKGEIFWWEKGNFWVITSHAYAKHILTSIDYTCDRSSFFISRMPNMNLALINDFFAVVSRMMVMSDAPEHTGRRRICYDGFSNQTLEQMQHLVVQTINEAIEGCISKGRIELVEDIAKIIPSTILADFFDIPSMDRANFYEWSNNMTQFFGGASQYRDEDGIEVNNSASQLRAYFVDLVHKRRLAPSNDFLSMLLKHQQAFALSDEDIISQAIMMLVAGQVTTTDQLCNNIYTLMHTKGALEQLKSEEVNWDRAIDELNRLDPAVTFIFRLAKNDTQIGQQKIKAGDVIFISTHAVNRDPLVFAEPDRCLFTRPHNKHISYGFGGHYCLGAKLAQLEMKKCFQALFQRFPNLRIASDEIPKRKHHSLAFSGFESLTLQF